MRPLSPREKFRAEVTAFAMEALAADPYDDATTREERVRREIDELMLEYDRQLRPKPESRLRKWWRNLWGR